jgi:DNA-binding NarL/FixJ family response regulator
MISTAPSGSFPELFWASADNRSEAEEVASDVQQYPARERREAGFGPKLIGSSGDEAQNMNKVILADSQAIFRAGTAKVLAMDEDLRIIAQCTDLDRMMHAITTFPGSIVVFAASLRPDMARLRTVLEASNSRGIVIAENTETASSFLQQGFRGVVFRNVTGQALVECVRRVAAGDTWAPPQLQLPDSPEEDMVGTRVRDRLTPKEMRIVALIVQGCKNREIALRLKTTEQVIKNYLRSIYDKTGVSDRLELALFTIHHRVLAQAAAEVGSKLEAEMQQAPAISTTSPALAQS